MARPGVDPHLFVIFGGTGDLAGRMLLPALYEVSNGLSEASPPFRVLGCARHPLSEAEFRATSLRWLMRSHVAPRPKLRRWVDRVLSYQSLGAESADEYRALADRVVAVEKAAHLPGHRVFYLALPSEAIPATVEALGRAGLNHGPGWTRLVIEKPFGRDLASAEKLNEQIHAHFDEPSIYRIDHYLGKETVQNLIVFRFANMLFESVWNRDRVDHVEITVAENLGVEDRATYYDHSGALRDMVQSHLTQLLALTAMEVPSSLDADQVRNEKVKVLRSIEPIRPEDVVRGQYRAGALGGQRLPGYREEPGARPRSPTETFVALRLRINSWRWHGVPFFLRTGKRLPAKRTEIVVHFRSPPVWFFGPRRSSEITANRLTITLQPDEGFELAFEIKRPGHAIELETHRLHFLYSEAFGPLADAYQTLILDIMRGDQTLFVRADEAEEAWRVYAPILTDPPPLQPYPAGTWGPKAADRLIAAGGHRWSVD